MAILTSSALAGGGGFVLKGLGYMADKRPVSDASLFTFDGTSFLALLKNATVKTDAKHHDASGQADGWEWAQPTKYKWEMDCELNLAADGGSLLVNIGDQFTVAYNTGGDLYSGPAVVTSASHMMQDGDLQKQKITLMGRGQPSFS